MSWTLRPDLNVVVRLHGHNVRPVGEQQQVVGNLQMMRPGRVSAREKTDRFQVARIRRIQYRDSIAEHVADINMPTVAHDLNAVRPSAKIGIG
jgi:hypothetical protein